MLENNCSALILAGGRGQRMQTSAYKHTEKCLQLLNKKPLAGIALASIPNSIRDIYVSANTNQDSYKQFTQGVGCVTADADCYPDYSGPLAGIASTLMQIESDWLYVLPADVVFTPHDLFEQLKNTAIKNNSMLSFVVFKDRIHPLFMLINKKLFSSLNDYLLDGQRKVQYWVKQNGIACDVQASIPLICLDETAKSDNSASLEKNTFLENSLALESRVFLQNSYFLENCSFVENSLFLNINTPDDLRQAHEKIISKP